MLTIVPNSVHKQDPRQLLYHFPSISAIRYSKLASQFYHWKMVEVAEEIARLQGLILVPSRCIHWKRKQELDEKYKIKIGKHMYYLLKKENMTDREKEKLKEFIEQQKSSRRQAG